MLDTDTRLLPPGEITDEVIGELPEAAARFLAEALEFPQADEPARRLSEVYRGRHRTTDDLNTRVIPAAARHAAVGVPLPRRAHGAALAAPSAWARRLAWLGGMLHRSRQVRR